MKKSTSTWLKHAASYASLLIGAACGGGGGGGGGGASVACAQSQDLAVAFKQAVEQTPSQGGQKHLLVKMSNPQADINNLQKDVAAEYGGNSNARVSKVSQDTVAVDLPDSSPASKTIDRYISDKKVSAIEPDYPTHLVQTADSADASDPIQATPEVLSPGANADSHSASSTNSEQSVNVTAEMKAQAAAGKQVVVAIIDSGVDYTHKDLAPYMWHNPGEIANNGIDDDHNGFVDDVYGWDFVNNDNNPMADDAPSYHGTHVAGIVKQAALLAEQGINVKIMALKYLDSTGTGRTSAAIRAIDYAIQNGAIVLNNSWGSSSYSTALSDAIDRVRQKNALFLAAAGNGDSNGNGINIDQNPFYPAAYPQDNVITISAANNSGVLAGWSNYGAIRSDVGAPGVSINSTLNGNRYGLKSGTSMATPYVSGLAAMVWSLHPDFSYSEIKRILMQSTTATPSLKGKVVSNGFVSRDQALSMAAATTHNPSDKGTPGLGTTPLCTP